MAMQRFAAGISCCLCVLLMAHTSDAARSLQRSGADPNCVCTLEYAPVCDPATGKTYPNACNARCNGVTTTQPGECPASSPTDGDGCICTLQYDPVCDPATGKTYGNACQANCAGVTNTRPGECPATGTSPSGCICTLQYAPVCDPATGKTYGNACQARCAGVTNTRPGECPTSSSARSPVADCICPALYAPVCDTLTGKTYSNACQANCAGAKWTVPGACSDATTRCAASCPSVPQGTSYRPVYDPVCIISKSATTPSTLTYFNPCIAKCYANAASVVGSYKGNCNAQADAACASGVTAGSLVCSTTTATEYPTRCYALQLDGARANTYSGQCRQAEAVRLAAKCPPSTPEYPLYQTNCFVDPCSNAKCSDAKAVCVSRYCAGFFRSTFLHGQCQAVFINRAGSIVTTCPTPSIRG